MVSDVTLKPYTACPMGASGPNRWLFRCCDATTLQLRSVVNSWAGWFMSVSSPVQVIPTANVWTAHVQKIGHVVMSTVFPGELIFHVVYYTGMDPCTLRFLSLVKTVFAWGDNMSSLLKYSTRYYVPRWSNSACQMGSDRIEPRQRVCRKTGSQATCGANDSGKSSVPSALLSVNTGEGASFRLSTSGLFYHTKIYCAPNLQKRWRALCSALSLAVMLPTKAWNLGPFQKLIYICSFSCTRLISRRNMLQAGSMDLLLSLFLYEIWKQICRDEPPCKTLA